MTAPPDHAVPAPAPAGATPPPPPPPELARLVADERLDEVAAEALFERVLRGHLVDAQIAAVLALLARRGPGVAELAGAARAMRRHVEPVPFTPANDEALIDTCGTGGAAKTFNVSTAAAIVAASARPAPTRGIARVVVAKHGNRSRTGRGSAEVLAEIGVNIDAPPAVQARCLTDCGVCFCFAMHHHPAMRHAAAARRALGFPTIFNVLGPLTNPARAARQLIGVWSADLVEPVAGALARLGAQHALVVHGTAPAAEGPGHVGLDELSTLGPSRAVEIARRSAREILVNPAALGFAPARLAELQAADVRHAAQIIRDVLDRAPGPARDMTLLNAAAALAVADAVETLAEGIELARDAIDSGRARATLDGLIQASRRS